MNGWVAWMNGWGRLDERMGFLEEGVRRTEARCMTELLHRELTEKIIGVYYDVYNGLSRTYPEFIYESAMMRDLGRQ